MKHTKVWIWLFAASAVLNILLFSQMNINNRKQSEQPDIKGTYACETEGTLYRLTMEEDGHYCRYLAGKILESGRYAWVDENRCELTPEASEGLHGRSALIVGERLYEILTDGSVQTYEKVSQTPYYDNVTPAWWDDTEA